MPAVAMRRCLAAVSLLGLAGPLAAASPVRLASDEWCPYVCAREGRIDGGFVVELTTRALAAAGWQVEPLLLPLNRAVRQTVKGELDGIFAAPADPHLLLSPVLGYSRSCFYVRADDRWQFRGLATLRGKRLGVIGDYEYDHGALDAYIAANRDKREVLDFSYGSTAVSTNLRKLLGARFDVLLEHELVMQHAMRAVGAHGRLRQAGCLDRSFPLRVGFARANARSVRWLAALAEGMRKLEHSGELNAIRQRYGFPALAQGETWAR